MPLLLQNGAVLSDVSGSFVVVALHVTVVVPRYLHGDAASCGWFRAERAWQAVSVCSVHHVPDAVPPNVPLLAARGSCPFVLGRNDLGMIPSYLSLCTVSSISSRRSRHSSRNINKSCGSWPGSIFMLTSFSCHALVTSLVWPLYFSVKTFYAICPCPSHRLAAFPRTLWMVLLAQPDAMRSRTLRRSRVACCPLRSATALSVTVVVLHRVDAGWALP